LSDAAEQLKEIAHEGVRPSRTIHIAEFDGHVPSTLVDAKSISDASDIQELQNSLN